MIKFALTIVVASCVALVSAQSDTLVYRSAFTRGADKPYDTLGVISGSGTEFWVFGANTSSPSIEFGKLLPILGGKNGFLLGGGYLAYQPQAGKLFAEPFLLGQVAYGNFAFGGVLGSYVPLNGGTTALFSDELALTYQVTPGIRVGYATSFWAEQGFAPVYQFGPMVSFPLSKRAQLTLRSQQPLHGAPTVRVELKLKF